MNPSGGYNVLINSPIIKLPTLHVKADYKAWKSEVPLHFEPRTLGDITYSSERNDAVGGVRRQKYFVWYETRKNKTFSALALSLSSDLRATFKIDAICDNMDAARTLSRSTLRLVMESTLTTYCKNW
ncbi:hypothetical protein PI124_g4879 [Phytophthora idaei]|nr:hypothetical protein PI124_g4879 [Phytophthora idaei]